MTQPTVPMDPKVSVHSSFMAYKNKLNLRKSVRQLAVASLIAAMSTPAVPAFAQGTETEAFRLNPTVLRKRLFRDNLSVITGLNSVYQAKEQVNLARANLLPSVSLNGGVSGLAAGGAPSFGFANISFLLPFLLPSNWFALDAFEHQLAATGYAFNLVVLNQYASAYSVFNIIIGDMELLRVYERQYQNLKLVRDTVAALVQAGLASQTDLAKANGEASNAAAQVAKAKEVIARERATISRLLGIYSSKKIQFEEVHPAPLAGEDGDHLRILKAVYPKTPEALQIRSLQAAAESATWTRVFGFLGGATLNMETGGNGYSQAFAGVTEFGAAGSANVGFTLIPSIRLGSLNQDLMAIREREIRVEMSSVLEATIGSLAFAKAQLKAATDSEASFKKAFEGELALYQAGQSVLQNVLIMANRIADSALMKTLAQINVDNLRVTLSRTMITGQFEQIPKCRMTGRESAGGGPFGWIEDLFSGESSRISVDQLCGRRGF